MTENEFMKQGENPDGVMSVSHSVRDDASV